ncbi:hypothetical protein [Cellvibrio sp. QJXJ]|uniref:hypothetical protein n=1 Tax=Cellvibrio sp. QJXJ TaxID=2964606 RepID=UPI0021C3FE5B|nr:hypothetical protein [Cellvibrio sp. QJXJ]UUA74241.1 hypothetical protein NNX04_07320 [Cellvibrio sp. QJXJ]
MAELSTSGLGLFAPQDLDYYRELTRDLPCSVDLTRDECAAVLKAYDRGVNVLNLEELPLLNAVISKLKDCIHP